MRFRQSNAVKAIRCALILCDSAEKTELGSVILDVIWEQNARMKRTANKRINRVINETINIIYCTRPLVLVEGCRHTAEAVEVVEGGSGG